MDADEYYGPKVNGRTEVLRTPQHDDGQRHVYRKRDFPLALCGHISPDRTLGEAMKQGNTLLVCKGCAKLATLYGIEIYKLYKTGKSSRKPE